MQAIRVHETGGPVVLRHEELPRPEPSPGEALIRVEAAGVNFIDVYQRRGLYPIPTPFTPGQEAAGMVEAVGAGVDEVRAGDRVAWAGVMGAYAEYAVVPAARLVPLPEGIETAQAAAVLLQGMTAHYLATSTYPLKPGERCLIHAAAGGVGLLFCQIARARGARVIGTAGSEEKADLARRAGAEEVILYRRQDFVEEVRRITGGDGLPVVYDSVGRETFLRSIDCLSPRGMLVLYGQSSGPVEPFDPQVLARKGSLFLTRPILGHYTARREDLLARANDLFDWMREGRLHVRIDREMPLRDAAQAHRDLEGRKTSGKILLRVTG